MFQSTLSFEEDSNQEQLKEIYDSIDLEKMDLVDQLASLDARLKLIVEDIRDARMRLWNTW